MTATTFDREVRLQVAHNVRHLAGYGTERGVPTRWRDLLRGASLHRLEPAGLEVLADAGIRTVVDLRSGVEREEYPSPDTSPYGIETIAAPVFERDASPVGQAEDFPGYAVVYQRLLERGRRAYRRLAEVVAERDGGVLFHCAAGKDRTGVAAALLLQVAGVPDETVVEDYALSAELLRPLRAEWLPRMEERGIREERAEALMASPPNDMAQTLRHIRERWGSAEGYLRSIGVSATTISALRARATT